MPPHLAFLYRLWGSNSGLHDYETFSRLSPPPEALILILNHHGTKADYRGE